MRNSLPLLCCKRRGSWMHNKCAVAYPYPRFLEGGKRVVLQLGFYQFLQSHSQWNKKSLAISGVAKDSPTSLTWFSLSINPDCKMTIIKKFPYYSEIVITIINKTWIRRMEKFHRIFLVQYKAIKNV